MTDKQSLKRYRVQFRHFDFTANAVRHELSVKGGVTALKGDPKLFRQMPSVWYFVKETGRRNWPQKLEDLVELGALPFSVVAYHNVFLVQIRDAFVTGAYYPALAGTVALGERILNHLVLKFRNGRAAPPKFPKLHKKDSYPDWDKAITALRHWDVLTAEAEGPFRALSADRNRALHFNLVTEEKTRAEALLAYRNLASVLRLQFGAFDGPDWLAAGKGMAIVRKAWESHPFVKAIYLPQCWHVGPKHKLTLRDGSWAVESDPDVMSELDSDEEFIRLI